MFWNVTGTSLPSIFEIVWQLSLEAILKREGHKLTQYSYIFKNFLFSHCSIARSLPVLDQDFFF